MTKKIVSLGIFYSKKGKKYACHFLPEIKIVEAIKIVSKSGAGNAVFERKANTEKEALKLIESAIESGELI